jgi:hypothetical protein
LRTINLAEAEYQKSHPTYATIPELIASGLLDPRLEGTVSGYKFNVDVTASAYTATAMPVSNSKRMGWWGYYSLPDGVIRFSTSTSPTCAPCFPPDLSGKPVPW